jgi:hypothetical protein
MGHPWVITEKWATLHSRETLDIRSRRRPLLSTYRLSNKRRSFRFTRDRTCLGSKIMTNKLGLTDFRIDVWQWIKLHIRTTTLEHSGPRLSYRFSFAPDPSIIVCRIYFSDDESNPISAISPTDQRNIQDGWIELAMKNIADALESCELPVGFLLKSRVQFVLHISEGMGSKIVQEAERPLIWEASTVRKVRTPRR